jgi:hypothetical protein
MTKAERSAIARKGGLARQQKRREAEQQEAESAPQPRPIHRNCEACGRTLTGDHEKREGVCASFVGCIDRSRNLPREKPRKDTT